MEDQKDEPRGGPGTAASTFRLRRTEPSEGNNVARTFLAFLSFFTVGAADTDGSRWEVEEVDHGGVARTVFTHKERYAAEFEMKKLRAAQAER
ncbi:hypothetical protein BH10ACT3_BH10ACT3_15930 [soil metagenome]